MPATPHKHWTFRKTSNIAISNYIRMYARLFKLTWVLMSIVILCVIAMGLYAILDFIEKRAQKW